MTTPSTVTLPATADLRRRAGAALQALGCATPLGPPGGHGLPAGSPITGEVLFTLPETTPEQASAAIAEAASAFSVWRTTPAPVRGALVARLGELLVAHQADLATLVTLEAGKIGSEALGEVQEMIDVCQFAVGLSRQLYGRTIASERPGHRLMETWHPLGVVGVITAFNFPVAVWSWNAAIALVCGDTVVWKPSEITPLTALGARRWPSGRRPTSAPRRRCVACYWAGATWASDWSRTPGWRWSARPVRWRWDGRWARGSPSGSGGCCWSSVATMPRSSRRRPTWISPSGPSCSPRRAPPGNAARRCGG